MLGVGQPALSDFRGHCAGREAIGQAGAELPLQRHHLHGHGLGGPEIGVGRAQFARPFTVAREAGSHNLPHAGESIGPATVWSALHDLGAERIGHGIHAVTDPGCSTTWPTTGSRWRCARPPTCAPARSTTSKPTRCPRLLQAGVPVALSSDDPGMFDTDLTRDPDRRSRCGRWACRSRRSHHRRHASSHCRPMPRTASPAPSWNGPTPRRPRKGGRTTPRRTPSGLVERPGPVLDQPREAMSSRQAVSQRRQASAQTRQCSCMSAWLAHSSPHALQAAAQASRTARVRLAS
ncbi:Adenosine/AMP deaminase [Geodermatophilus sp. DSM 45219]|nr:Adenosine/AMP deaminase [Geodermatophilus sp. DSM 45219]